MGSVNGKLAARLADLEAGRITPAVPRDAATVVVIRPASDGPTGDGPAAGRRDGGGPGVEALMLRRTAAMKFAFRNAGVDAATVGFKSAQEIDEAIDNMNAALA